MLQKKYLALGLIVTLLMTISVSAFNSCNQNIIEPKVKVLTSFGCVESGLTNTEYQTQHIFWEKLTKSCLKDNRCK